MRLFFAAFPERETQSLIACTAATLMLGDGARPVPCENYHITLAFVGEVSSEQAASLRAIGPLAVPAFTVRFDTCEHWQGSEVVVLAASGCPPALHDLQCKLRGELDQHDLAADPRPFHPHVTIARKVAQAACAASDVGIFVDGNTRFNSCGRSDRMRDPRIQYSTTGPYWISRCAANKTL